jgi:hypothetical protein
MNPPISSLNKPEPIMKSTRKSASSLLALAALVALCQPPPKAQAQPLFVQQAYTCPQSPQNQVAVDYAGPQTGGDLNILAIGWNDEGATITNVTDSAGNTYQVAVPTFRGGGLSQAIYYATNILSGDNTVTVTFDQPAKYVDLRVTEYSGLSQDNPFDAGASASGTGTLADSGPVTTSQTNELLFAAGMTGSGFNGPAAGWVQEVITQPDSDIVQDMVAASPGTYHVPTTLGSAGWVMQVAAFRTGPPPTTGGGGKPTLVQQHYACPQSPQNQVAVAYANAQTAGNLNILAIGWKDLTANITNVTDSAGNTYQLAVPTFRGGGLSQAIYYAANILSGANTVTVTFDQPAKYVDLRVTEYSGLSQDNPFDTGASASGTGALADSGPVTTSQTNELLFAAGMTGASFTGPGTGWVQEVITQPDADVVEDMVAASAGTNSATAPLASSGWLMQVAAFRTGPPPSSAVGGLGFVQQAYTCPQSPQIQVAVDYASAQTGGNLNILAIGWNDVTANITSVTDSVGNTYQMAVPTFQGSGLSQAIYYAANILSGSNTVTVMFDQPAQSVDLRVTEYSGLSQDNPFDAGASASGTSALADSGLLMTSQTNELLFAAGMVAGSFTGPGAGYVQRVITQPNSDIVQDMVAVSVRTYNATAPLASSGWLMQVAAFKTGPQPTRTLYVQGNYACPQTDQDQVTVAYTNTQTAGNVNILAIGWNDVTANITSVTDSAGNTCQAAVPTSQQMANSLSQAIYYATNILSGSNTVTVMFDQPAHFVDLRATEYAGLIQGDPFDAGSSGNGSGLLADSGPLTTGQTNELLFAAGTTTGSFIGPAAGYVERMYTRPDSDIVEDMVADAAGTYDATAPCGASGWVMQVAAFKATPPPIWSGPLPVLELDRSSNGLKLLWLEKASAAGFVLESSDKLSPANWAQVPVAQGITNNIAFVTVSSPTGSKFYRLHAHQ